MGAHSLSQVWKGQSLKNNKKLLPWPHRQSSGRLGVGQASWRIKMREVRWIRELGDEHKRRGAALFIDFGFSDYGEKIF